MGLTEGSREGGSEGETEDKVGVIVGVADFEGLPVGSSEGACDMEGSKDVLGRKLGCGDMLGKIV